MNAPVPEGRECRDDKRASEPEKKTAMAGAGKTEAGKVADSSEKGQQRHRNLSDMPVRSPRKGMTQQSKKTHLIEKGDGDSEVKEASEGFKIDLQVVNNIFQVMEA